MTKNIKRMSKFDQDLVAALVIKYGAKEVRRIVDKLPGRSAGRPATKLQENDFQIWLAVERLRAGGMNKENAYKSVAKTLAAQTSRRVSAATLKGYYQAADKARIADPSLNEQLSRALGGIKEGLKFVQALHGGASVVVPAIFNRQK